jgi:Rhodanese-like domain
MAQYAHPEMLVDTAWVAEHGKDAGIRLVEVDVDTTAYDQGHISGAIAWNWTVQLCDTVQRDIIPKDVFEKLMADSGVGNNTTVILYGDNNNWFAAWALWQMKIYGHKDVRLMNGGRKKWVAEGRELTTEVPSISKETYQAMEPDMSLRAFCPRSSALSRPGATCSLMCAVLTSSLGRSFRHLDWLRPASAAATSLARRAFPGEWHARRTAASNRRTSLRHYIRARESLRRSRRSPIAGSGNAPAIRGSF